MCRSFLHYGKQIITGTMFDKFQQPGKVSPVYTAQTNPGRTRVRPGLKLTQVVFTRHFSKLTRVEPGLVVFSSVYTTETNPVSPRIWSPADLVPPVQIR